MFHCLGAGKAFLQASLLLHPLRNSIGLSFWACLPFFYSYQLFCPPLSSVGFGPLSFLFPSSSFSFLLISFFVLFCLGGEAASFFFFPSKKAFAFLSLSSPNITIVVTECDC